MQPPVLTPLRVITHAQIITYFQATEDEFMELLRRLKGKEKRLTSGAPGDFVQDVAAALRVMREG